MDEKKLFEVAAKITTPLSLASLVIVVLYLLYRQVLGLSIFSNLDQTGTYQVVTQVLFYLFVLAIVGLILGMGLFVFTKVYNPSHPALPKEVGDDGLKVVDVSIIEEVNAIQDFRKTWLKEEEKNIREKGVFPLIDIKVRNTGTEPIFLKKIEFDVKIYEAVQDETCYRAFPVSWEYSVLFDSHKKFDHVELNISQVVKPKGVDRFVIVVGQEMGYGEFEYVTYDVAMKLHYNEDSFIELDKFRIRVHSPVMFRPENSIGVKELPAT
ncbi:MAG: hypothetical protein M3362_14490 [Acidobacteriota bacterium]|nr:hypothetical protein [Acidobacteriota bacterium]